MPQKSFSGDEIVITDADRELVRQNGFIDAGPFRLWIDRDFVRSEVVTSPDLPALIYFFRVMEEVRRQHGRIYLMICVGEKVSPPPPENRRWSAEWDRKHGADGIAIVSPHNPLFAAMIGLLMRAMNLLRRTERPSAFFSTEAEARRWLETVRHQETRGAA